MIQVPDIAFGRPESICLVADYLCLVVQSFHSTVVDGHAEIVHQAILVASEHPGKVPHGFEPGMGCPPEPAIKIAFDPSGIGIGPEFTKGFLEQVGTIAAENFEDLRCLNPFFIRAFVQTDTTFIKDSKGNVVLIPSLSGHSFKQGFAAHFLAMARS